MPPALSDNDDSASSSGDDQIPPQKAGKDPQPDADEEDDDSEAEDEYVVEKILGHKFIKGEIHFDVKWQGYDDPKDRTWEPESNMSGALDVLNEYYQDLGGKPQPKGGQKRKAKKSETESRTSTPASTAKRVKTEKEWSPPPGSWEHDVEYVDTVEERLNPKTGERERFAYLIWRNERKTQHPLAQIYQKCPQKMLTYYERHLVFTGPGVDDVTNGDENDGNNDDGSDEMET